MPGRLRRNSRSACRGVRSSPAQRRLLSSAALWLPCLSAFGVETGWLEPGNLDAVAGFSLPLLVTVIALSTFVSEDLTCIAAGLLVSSGAIAAVPAILACFAGIFVGDGLLYLTGRYLGRPAVRRAPLKWLVTEADLDRSSEWFTHNGPTVIFTSRFLPGTRLPTYVAAGLLRMNVWRFSLYFLLAAAVWTPILVGLSIVLGHTFLTIFEVYQQVALWTLAGLALAIWLIVEWVVPAFTYRGRRFLVSRWRRWTRWEFWPPWLFYPPVVAYVLCLGLRHRCLTLFTCCNPSIEAGGFIGESKSDILDHLHIDPAFVARFKRIPGGPTPTERTAQVLKFMHDHAMSYPLVLKPDAGQRGAGVAFVQSDEDVEIYMKDMPADVIAQAYAVGEEFGVFYYRCPDEDTGRLFSITAKRMISVVGDGVKTLESLILGDDRAVCQAAIHLRKHSGHLFDVPRAGERIPLVELGTHCRGATFYDGCTHATPGLLARIDEISKGDPGFFFGRYDIRTSSVEEMEAGRGFQIVEVNGVTSEATHIYDPSNSLWTAYRVLMRQWAVAFEIGRRNRGRGVEPVGMGALIRLVRDYREGHRVP